MDKETKLKADELFHALGMNLTTAFNIFVNQSIRQGRIPFEISLNANRPFSDYDLNRMKQSMRNAGGGNYIVKTLDELKALEDD
jgi:DNA-damage-inducible protein J